MLIFVISVSALLAKGCQEVDSYSNLFEHYSQQSKSHEQQIKELRRIRNEEALAHQRMTQEFISEINRLEADYNSRLNSISQQRHVIRNRIIDDHDSNPSTLTEHIREVFGIPIE